MNHTCRSITLVCLASLLAAADEAAPAPAPVAAPAAAAAAQAAVAPPAPAAQPAVPGLTLPQAIALALARNETPEISFARVERAHAALNKAKAAMRPQLVLGGSLSTADVNEFPHGGDANENTAWNAQADLTLFNPRAWAGVSSARFAEQAQIRTSMDQRRALAYSVTDIFLNVLAAEKQVDAAQRRRQVSESAVGDAKARLQAGLTTRTDVTRAELSLAEAELTLTRAKRFVTASRLALSDLIVNPIDGGLEMPTPVAIPGRDGKALRTLGLAFRDDLKALQFQEAAADASVRGEKSRYLPTVGARAAISSYHTTAPVAKNSDDQNEVTLSLVAQWSLYDGGDREASIDSAQSSRREAGLTRSQELRALQRDIDTALADLDTSEASLAQANARDRLAKANAEEVRARYRQGLATALEDADAISSQFEAESNLVAALLDLARSKLALRRLVGYWPTTDHEPEAGK